MLVLTQVITILLAFISQQHEAVASSIVLPINKHTDAAANPLYSTHAYFDNSQYPDPRHNTPAYFNFQYHQQSLLIDLDAPFIWHYSYPHQDSCDTCPYAVTCREFPCTDLRTTFSYQDPTCPPPTNHSMYEGYFDCELCPVNIISPVTRSCSQALPTYDQFMLTTTNNGKNVLFDNLYTTYPTAASTPPWTFDPFPSNVLGVLALSSSPYALPAYLHDPVNRTIALCLPSTISNPGVLFLGKGPYYLNPKSNVDVTSLLSYTALLKQPNSFGYFIGVNAIVIRNSSIVIPANATTKISTLEPYTKLRTDIYNLVVRRFKRVMTTMTRVKTSIPSFEPLVPPFGLCFNGTNAGLKVPDIDLMLQDGKKWTISTGNSIKQVTEDVACLAVVDGGPASEHAIVIGTYQFEDSFLLFDLEKSRLGFSSSLLRRGTSCSNFDFTVTQ